MRTWQKLARLATLRQFLGLTGNRKLAFQNLRLCRTDMSFTGKYITRQGSRPKYLTCMKEIIIKRRCDDSFLLRRKSPSLDEVASLLKCLYQTQLYRQTRARTHTRTHTRYNSPNEWPVHRRIRYVHKAKQTSMPSVGFEPVIPATKRLQAYASNRTATRPENTS